MNIRLIEEDFGKRMMALARIENKRAMHRDGRPQLMRKIMAPSTAEVFKVLTDEPQTVAEIASKVIVAHRQVNNVLRTLERNNMAEKAGHRIMYNNVRIQTWVKGEIAE